jgi:ribosomal protein S2
MMASSAIKIVDELDKRLQGFENHLRDRRPLIPDLVVCMNPLENHTLLHECVNASIPTIGVVDTTGDPTKVTYPIPANDDR